MLSSINLTREQPASALSYVGIYAAAALALVSVYYLPGPTGALLGVSLWAFGLVPLVKLVRQRWLK